MEKIEKPLAGGANPWADFPVLPVAEKFASINGEGPNQGRLAAFIRLQGCNLRCSYCDTAWAQDIAGKASWEDIDDIVSFVCELPVACVTITGGEPLLQPQLKTLVAALHEAAAEGKLAPEFTIEIETNGSLSLAELDAVRSAWGEGGATLSFTMDVKCPSSGMADECLADNLNHLRACDALKFVVGDDEDLAYSLKVLNLLYSKELPESPLVMYSPVFGVMEPARIVEFMGSNGLAYAKLQLQLHKLVYPGVERGV